ncbi:MAG: hypothetical protein CME85_09790 [Henriciella sp.]|nr:helix-turn-helix domain-containing protein [Henriciella sp.]MBK75772.1 hypothetical protein [Henriciella sp.]
MKDDERKLQSESSGNDWVSGQSDESGYTGPDETIIADESADSPYTDSLIDNFTAGGILRAARERQELSIDAVSSALMLNHRVIECLERTNQPPGYDMSRTRIAAKSYAKYLGVPADAVLADFPTDEQPRLATAVPRSSVSETSRGVASRYALPAAVMACVVVLGAAIAFLIRPGEFASSRSTPSVAERVVAVNTAQESLFARSPLDAAQSDDLNLSLVSLRPAWVEVRGPDGTIFRSRTMARGEVYYPRVGAGWTITVKDGTAFEWRVDDRAVGNLAETAIPVYSASIDEAAALAAQQTEPTLAAASNSRPSR